MTVATILRRVAGCGGGLVRSANSRCPAPTRVGAIDKLGGHATVSYTSVVITSTRAHTA